jgi:hypothetical protein
VQVNNGFVASSEPSLISMDKKFFNFKREMKQLFAESANQFGALGLDEEEKQARHNVDD